LCISGSGTTRWGGPGWHAYLHGVTHAYACDNDHPLSSSGLHRIVDLGLALAADLGVRGITAERCPKGDDDHVLFGDHLLHLLWEGGAAAFRPARALSLTHTSVQVSKEEKCGTLVLENVALNDLERGWRLWGWDVSQFRRVSGQDGDLMAFFQGLLDHWAAARERRV